MKELMTFLLIYVIGVVLAYGKILPLLLDQYTTKDMRSITKKVSAKLSIFSWVSFLVATYVYFDEYISIKVKSPFIKFW